MKLSFYAIIMLFSVDIITWVFVCYTSGSVYAGGT